MKKNKNLTQILTALLITVFLASCSSVGQISLTKSRYGNGIGFSLDKAMSKEEQKRLEDKTAIIKERAKQRRIGTPKAINSLKMQKGELTVVNLKEQLPAFIEMENMNLNSAEQSEKVVLANSKKNNVFDQGEVNLENHEPVITEAKPAKRVDRKSKKKSKSLLLQILEGAFLVALIFAIILPPLGVAIYEGITSRFWICLLLTLLFFLPGIIYAVLIVTGTI